MRKEFRLLRTTCGCPKCQLWCEHQPGYLVPSDLDRLIPADQNAFDWAEEHLRASLGFRTIVGPMILCIPSLVPAKQTNGHCHWYSEGHCKVHDVAPYGCAFLDQHLTKQSAEKRNEAARESRGEAFENQELYAALWQHLWDQGLCYTTTDEDRQAVFAEFHKLDQAQQRKQIRQEKEQKRSKATSKTAKKKS